MADWRGANPSNEPETCLWCGEKLRWSSRPVHPGPVEDESWQEYWTRGGHKERVRADKPGGYRDGFFCGLRCGYQFGVALAGHGRRLAPKAGS